MEQVITPTTPTSTGRTFPSIWAGLGMLFFYIFCQLVIASLAVIIVLVVQGKLTGMAANPEQFADMKIMAFPALWGVVAANITALSVCWIYLRKDNRSAKIGLKNWSQLSLQSTILIAGALIAGAYIFSYAYSEYLFPGIDLQKMTNEMIAAIPRTPVNWVFLIVTISILPGIAEELVFRGFLQNSFANHMPRLAAIGLSSALFAAMHMQLYAFPLLFILGAIFGYLYCKTGSLRVNIALHVINNAAALLLS
jgi:uncharacterized protein